MTGSNQAMLYRGINKIDDDDVHGQIIPKGDVTHVVADIDGKAKIDGTFKIGYCESNTARAQQIETALYGACAISTTRSEKQAIKFATSGNTVAGYVYILSETKLTDAGIALYEFSDPIYPEESEVTLVCRDTQPLPQSTIVEKYAVTAHGEKEVGN